MRGEEERGRGEGDNREGGRAEEGRGEGKMGGIRERKGKNELLTGNCNQVGTIGRGGPLG